MADLTSDLLAAVVAATPERKLEVLQFLRGESTGKNARAHGRNDIERYVSLKDAAAFLGVSRRSVWRWQVPSHRLGARTRFKLSEVVAYVESDTFKKRMAELKEQRLQEELP